MDPSSQEGVRGQRQEGEQQGLSPPQSGTVQIASLLVGQPPIGIVWGGWNCSWRPPRIWRGSSGSTKAARELLRTEWSTAEGRSQSPNQLQVHQQPERLCWLQKSQVLIGWKPIISSWSHSVGCLDQYITMCVCIPMHFLQEIYIKTLIQKVLQVLC